MAKRSRAVMKIFDADAEFMAQRREHLPPGWWIVDVANDFFFDGPYATKEAAVQRYNRLPSVLRNALEDDP
jgi:hypothetical protein